MKKQTLQVEEQDNYLDEYWAKINQQLIDGATAAQELEVTKAYLALAISQLPKGMLKVSLTEQARLGDQPLRLQAKSDANGNVFIRTVKSFG